MAAHHLPPRPSRRVLAQRTESHLAGQDSAGQSIQHQSSNGTHAHQPRLRARRGVALAATATLAAALTLGAGMPAMAQASQPSAAGGRTPTGGTNYATPANTTYLQAHAPNDHMGSTLAPHQATSVSRSAIPLLPAAAAALYGLDVSSHQGNVNWASVTKAGAKFSYSKATEGSYYTNPYFSQQYAGSYNAGMIRGAYAFAIPSYSSGTAQADYFASHGGGWSKDNHTLPGALDIEYNPYGSNECYGLSQSAMVSWVRAFLNEYHARTTRWAVIYTTRGWWSACTGNNGGFASNAPLWIANYASSAGTLPAGWGFYTFWQFASSGTFPGDQDVFNGAADRLLALANNT